MGCRNYCAGYFNEETGEIHFWIQAEKEVGVKGTKGYLVSVPKLVFGQAGYHLHTQTKQHLIEANHGYGHHPGSALQHQGSIGGFVIPGVPQS